MDARRCLEAIPEGGPEVTLEPKSSDLLSAEGWKDLKSTCGYLVETVGGVEKLTETWCLSFLPRILHLMNYFPQS